jgi:hypothetical protein
MSSGPIADCFILGFSYVVPLLISFRLTTDCLDGPFSICYGLVKKWASTIFLIRFSFSFSSFSFRPSMSSSSSWPWRYSLSHLSLYGRGGPLSVRLAGVLICTVLIFFPTFSICTVLFFFFNLYNHCC